MPHSIVPSESAKDAAVAAALMSSPAWAPWLASVNELLTTITLLCGALLGIGRLWRFWTRRRETRPD
ncbi:MAG: hypothetical protein Kow0032_00840 [Methyloligellaceae bacterium]